MDNKFYGLIKKYVRGSIWFYNEPEEITNAKLAVKDHTMAYSHPYLILSNQSILDNPRNPMVIAVPMTSNTSKSDVGDVIAYGIDGKGSRILCAQVTAICTKFIGDFMGFADENTMQQVEDTLLNCIGMKSARDADQKIQDQFAEIISLKEEIAALKEEIAMKDTEIQALQIPKIQERVETLPVLEPENSEAEEEPEVRVISASEEEAKILQLVESHTYKDAAKFLGMTETQLNSRVYSIRKRLGISPGKRRKGSVHAETIEFVDATEPVVSFEIPASQPESENEPETEKFDESELLELEYFGEVKGSKKTSMNRKKLRK